jgi:hypothetical protein
MPIAGILTGGLAGRAGGGDQTERGYHPWCAAYSRVCAAFMSRRLVEHRLVIRGGLDDVPVRLTTDQELTLAEYNELEALHGHHR